MRHDSTTPHRIAALPLSIAVLLALIASVPLATAQRARRGRSTNGTSRPYYDTGRGGVLVGGASWYGPGFHGRRTASGERFNRNAMTLASRSLPFGTRVRVTNLKNSKSAIARVNDRGPFHRGRIVDLSQGLARRLGITGVGRVKVEILKE